MLVSELGEFGLIERLTEELGITYPPSKEGRPRPGLLVDLGDDAVVTERHDAALIWTTDTMVADVHFLPGRSSWESVGWKALAVNLSDIAAMGGTPHLALVTLALPDDFCVEDAVALYRGLKEATMTYETVLGGGDIVRSPVFSITVALSGWADEDALTQPRTMTRASAHSGDLVAVTGHLGDSAGGLKLLQEGAEIDSEAKRRLVEAHERPTPRIAMGRTAVQAGVRCAMDVSDGLMQDLGHIARASGVGIRVEASRLPLSGALLATFPEEAVQIAIGGGEDYELVLVAPDGVIDALKREADTPLTVIGVVVADGASGLVIIDGDSGVDAAIRRRGWDHFPRPSG